MPAVNDGERLDLLESVLNVSPFLPFSSTLDPYRDLFTRLGWFRGPVVPPLHDSQNRGEAIPVYLNDQGLKFLRDLSRRVSVENEYAQGALENRVSFIAGKGFTFKVEGTTRDVPKWLIARAQAIVDLFVDEQEYGELEQELVRRGDEDGESFQRFFYKGDGTTEVRIVEPEHVITPPDHVGKATHAFGVETAEGDIETPVAYWVIEDPIIRIPKRLDASQILHIKCNARRTWKRGLPVWYCVTENLIRIERCLRNFAVMSQLVATYSVIRKHKGSPASAVAAFREQLKATSVQDPITGESRNIEQALPGGVHDVPANVELEFPGSEVNVGGYVQTLQADLRAVGSRMVMPEYMISGDASNANYSSTMVAESPSVRKFERDQSMYGRKFAEAKGRRPSVLWRVLLNAERCGKLPRGSTRLLKVSAEGPNLVVRDKTAETNRNKILSDAGILSKPKWAQQEGLDYEEEVRQGAGQQPQQPMGGEMPGASPSVGDAPAGMGLTEGCVLNKDGKRHHDDKTGHPCNPTPKAKADARRSERRRAKRAGKSGGGRDNTPPSAPSKVSPEHQQDARRWAMRDLLVKVGGKAQAMKDAATRLGQAAWSKLSPRQQKAAAVALGAAKAIHHKAEWGRSKAMDVAVEAAKQRGLSEQQVKGVQTALKVAEAVSAWTLWVPVTYAAHAVHLEGVAELVAVKGSALLPVAALGYLAYSTAVNPLATLRAARAVIGGKVAVHESESGISREQIEALCDHAEQLADDWYQSLLAVALDQSGGDLAAAMRSADEAYQQHPQTPAESEGIEESAGDCECEQCQQGKRCCESLRESAEWDEDAHPRAEDGKFGSGGGGGSKTESDGRPASGERPKSKARQDHEAEVARLDAEHAKAMKAHEKAYEEWGAAHAKVDDDYEAAVNAWTARGDARQERINTIDDIDAAVTVSTEPWKTPGTNPDAKIEAAQFKAAVEEYAGAWAANYGEGGTLERRLKGTGLVEDGDLEKIRSAAARGTAAIAKAVEKHHKLLDAVYEAQEKVAAAEAIELPAEPVEPDDAGYLSDDPDAVAAYERDYAAYEKAQEKYDAAVERRDARIDFATEKFDTLTQRYSEAQEGVELAFADHEEKVSAELEKVKGRITKAIEKEDKADVEPPPPKESDYPDEPDMPDDPDYPDEPEEDEDEDESDLMEHLLPQEMLAYRHPCECEQCCEGRLLEACGPTKNPKFWYDPVTKKRCANPHKGAEKATAKTSKEEAKKAQKAHKDAIASHAKAQAVARRMHAAAYQHAVKMEPTKDALVSAHAALHAARKGKSKRALAAAEKRVAKLEAKVTAQQQLADALKTAAHTAARVEADAAKVLRRAAKGAVGQAGDALPIVPAATKPRQQKQAAKPKPAVEPKAAAPKAATDPKAKPAASKPQQPKRVAAPKATATEPKATAPKTVAEPATGVPAAPDHKEKSTAETYYTRTIGKIAADLAGKQSPERDQYVRNVVAEVYDDMTLLMEYKHEGLVDLPSLYKRVERMIPGITKDEFKYTLHNMWGERNASRDVELHTLNEVREKTPEERSAAIQTDGGALKYYVYFKPEEQTRKRQEDSERLNNEARAAAEKFK